MSDRASHNPDFERKRLLYAAGLVAVAATLSFGQDNAPDAASPTAPNAVYVPTLTFDVASIRESKPGDSFVVGGRNTPHASILNLTNVTVLNLIEMAYGISDSRLSSKPDWLGSVRFNVQAKADSSADAKLAKLNNDQAMLERQHMVQVLLADRFRLKVHWEKKVGTIYTLVIAKKGPKLHEAKSEVWNPDGIKDSDDIKRPSFQSRGSPIGNEIVAQRVPMELLVGLLAGALDTTVLDKTGLNGNYEFTLQYDGTRSSSGTDEAANWPPLETAVQEQLGLKLEPQKGSVPILVIDHLEKPSEN